MVPDGANELSDVDKETEGEGGNSFMSERVLPRVKGVKLTGLYMSKSIIDSGRVASRCQSFSRLLQREGIVASYRIRCAFREDCGVI